MFGLFKEKATLVSAGLILAASNALQVMAQTTSSASNSSNEEIIGSTVGAVAIMAISIGIFCCIKKCNRAAQNPAPIQMINPLYTYTAPDESEPVRTLET